jgi:hypothetical protein
VLDTALSILCARWREQGVGLRSGVSVSELNDFEMRNAVILPADFRSFLRLVNGMDENEMDATTGIRFWSLQEIRSVAEELGRENESRERFRDLYVFADYSLWAHGYAIRLTGNFNDTNPISIIEAESPIHVATSFSHFLERYLEDPPQLFG